MSDIFGSGHSKWSTCLPHFHSLLLNPTGHFRFLLFFLLLTIVTFLANFNHGQLNVAEENGTPEAQTSINFKYYKHKDQGDHRKKNQRILASSMKDLL